jgi:hypothetical protein
MRDHLAATDHQTAEAMARHADVLWDARCGEPAINAINEKAKTTNNLLIIIKK